MMDATLRENLARQLRRDEEERAQAYQDHLGYWTIGVGRLIDARKPGAGLRDSEIDLLLANDIEDRVAALRRALPWFDSAHLNDARRAVLLNMAFQLGTSGLLAFKQALAHVEHGRWKDASAAMLDSLWARQTPLRASRLAQQMEQGSWN